MNDGPSRPPFTLFERLMLTNQYEILKSLAVTAIEKARVEDKLTALESGYDQDFLELADVFPAPLSDVVYKEVRQILQMFRALANNDTGLPSAHFVGFDGNDETEHFAYSIYLLNERRLWGESRRKDYNTHSPTLHYYRRMLEVWKKLDNDFELTPEQRQELVSLAPPDYKEE